jgi:hypothetical protein
LPNLTLPAAISPDLNTIEQASEAEGLVEALEAAISVLSVRDSRGFFEQRGYRASVYPP